MIIAALLVTIGAGGQNVKNLQNLVKSSDPEKHDSIYYELAKSYYQSDQIRTKYYATLSKETSDKYQHVSWQIRSRRVLGLVWEQGHNFDTAKYFFLRAIQLAKQSRLNNYLVDLYNDLGLVNEEVDAYDSAVYYLILAYNKASETRNAKQKAIISGNLGLTYCYVGDFSEATFYLEEAILQKEKMGIKTGLNLNRINLTRAYNELGKFDEAIEELSKIELDCVHGCEEEISSDIVYQKGYLNFKLHKINEASSYFATAILGYRKIGEQRKVAHTLYYLALTKLANGSASDGLSLLKETEILAQATNHNRLLRDTYFEMANVYEQMGRADMQSIYQKKFIQLNNRIFNTNIAKRVKDIQLFEQQKKSDAVIRHKDDELWNSRSLSFLLVLACVTVLIGIYLIYRDMKRGSDVRRTMEGSLLRMLDERELKQRQLLQTDLEINELTTSVRAFLHGPVATLGGLSSLLKNAETQDEYRACADKIGWLCRNISTVLDNMNELLILKDKEINFEEVGLGNFAEEIHRAFKGKKNCVLLSIDVKDVKDASIVTDKKILHSLVSNAISYFDHISDDPVVEVGLTQSQFEEYLQITIKHHSTSVLLPDKNRFNYMTVFVAAGKLDGTIQVTRRLDYTLFEISIPFKHSLRDQREIVKSIYN